jgi:F420H(2)-dependent quinone reductase
MLRALLIVLAVLAACFTMPWWMPRAWYRALHYPGGRPSAFTKRLNSAQAWLSARGVGPSFVVTLETTGRRTGRTLNVVLVMAEVGGERYLVSMLGDNADWVRNARARGGEAVLRHGAAEHVRLEEVPVSARAPILKTYLQRAPGARPHFEIGPDAPLEQFTRVATGYPVFRILPSTSSIQ